MRKRKIYIRLGLTDDDVAGEQTKETIAAGSTVQHNDDADADDEDEPRKTHRPADAADAADDADDVDESDATDAADDVDEADAADGAHDVDGADVADAADGVDEESDAADAADGADAHASEVDYAAAAAATTLSQFRDDKHSTTRKTPCKQKGIARLSKQRVLQQAFAHVFLGNLKRTSNIGEISLAEVNSLLPRRHHLPNSRMSPFVFADRLGLFMTDEKRRSGEYPAPHGGTVCAFDQAKIMTDVGRNVLRATRDFRGKPRYDFVQIRGKDGVPWYAQVLLFFSYCEAEKYEQYAGAALVSYLTPDPRIQRRCPTKTGFQWTSRFPDCVDVRNIIRPVVMAHIPWLSTNDAPTFVLMDQ